MENQDTVTSKSTAASQPPAIGNGALTAQLRLNTGKGVARKLRQNDLIPAVVYGGEKRSLSLSLSPRELLACVDPEKKRNTLISLTIEGASANESKESVLLKDVKINPLRGNITHVDFQRIDPSKPVVAKVPLKMTGVAAGVKLGGVMAKHFRTLDVECIPEKIPGVLAFDCTALNLGDSVTIADLVAPEGVKIAMDSSQTIAQINVARAAKAETVAEVDEEEEGDSAEDDAAGDSK